MLYGPLFQSILRIESAILDSKRDSKSAFNEHNAFSIAKAQELHLPLLASDLPFARATLMKQPGLDDRERDEDGRIRLKRGDTLNEHLTQPIPEFPDDATLQEMRDATGELGINKIRKAAKKLS
jgi:hypothetical protein